MIAIVTSRSFILCESVNFITIAAEPDWSRNKLTDFYVVEINYIPIKAALATNNSNNSSFMNNSSSISNTQTIHLKIIGEQKALALVKELISQIREQIPDQPYLDSMITKILNGSIGDILDDKPPVKANKIKRYKIGDMYDDLLPAKTSRTRQKKR